MVTLSPGASFQGSHSHRSLKYLLQKCIVTRSSKCEFQICWDMITRLCIERRPLILRLILYLGNLKQIVQSWPYLNLLACGLTNWRENAKNRKNGKRLLNCDMWSKLYRNHSKKKNRSSTERSNFALQVHDSRRRITLLAEISCSTHLTIEC